MLVVVLVLENPDRFAIRLTEQISCRTSVSLRSRNPNAPRTSTTTRHLSWSVNIFRDFIHTFIHSFGGCVRR